MGDKELARVMGITSLLDEVVNGDLDEGERIVFNEEMLARGADIHSLNAVYRSHNACHPFPFAFNSHMKKADFQKLVIHLKRSLVCNITIWAFKNEFDLEIVLRGDGLKKL